MARKYCYLTLEHRNQIATMFAAGQTTEQIAQALDVHKSTVYNELHRGFTGNYDRGRPIYDAELAHSKVQASIKRRGRKW